jgi:hypothetical protein
VVRRSATLGPVPPVQIPVHEQLSEGEEAEHHRVPVDRPSGLAPDRLLHSIEICSDVEVLLGWHLGKLDSELEPELVHQGQVVVEVFFGVPQPEPLPDVGPFHRHWHKNQGGSPRLLAATGFEPAKHAQRQIEDVYSLLLDKDPGIVIGLEQTRL